MSKFIPDEVKAYIKQRHLENVANGMQKTVSQQQLADEYEITDRSVRNYCADESLTSGDFEVQPSGEFVKGTSTLYDAQGAVKLKWVRAENKFDREKWRAWIDTLSADVPRAAPIPPPTDMSHDTLTVLPFGDPHLGLYSWAAETGDDFDLAIAERDLCNAVDRLVKCTPRSKQALIVNLGDFFHADNNTGETTRSHVKLDTDSRWAKVLLIGLKAMRQCIVSALEYHEQVTVINAIGNHDDHSSMFLTIALTNIYENEPRVHIIDSPTVVHYYHFGKNLIGVHHGHGIKPQDLPLLMAADRPTEWSASTTRVWLTGHLHQDIVREYQGIKVETFRTLAARDAWAASKGYRSGRDMKALVFHRDFGEIERHTVSVEMLRNS